MNKKKKILAIVLPIVGALLIAGIVVLCVLGIPLISVDKKMKADKLPQASTEALAAPDKIHFLNTGGSDAILLESNGHFALIDAAEDTDNPRCFPGLELEGYEQKVLAYLKKSAKNSEGKVHLDFVLGTHSHSDHIGGFDTVILDPDVTVGKAYLKKYDASKIKDHEINDWDNQEVYDQMVAALNVKNVPIVSEPDGTPFTLGNFTITLFNTDDPYNANKVGENDQSFGVLVEKNGTRVFLAGDMDDLTGDETRLAPKIGKVDMLKVGHHSYAGSSTKKFVKALSPDICVITNKHDYVDRITLARFERICKPTFLTTDKENGVLAVIGDNGKIDCYGQIH